MIRLSRRWAMVGLAGSLAPFKAFGASFAASPPPVNEDRKLVFKIMREGTPIGQYAVDIATTGKLTTVDVTTHIKVSVLFLTAYHLSHTGREIWSNGQFVSYKGQTNDNGTQHVVSIRANPDDTTVVANGRHLTAPKGAIPASLWNLKFVNKSVLIDPDNGRVVPVKVVDMGPETLVVQGVKETANHYHIHGMKRDVWMMNGEPVRFQLIGSDNSAVVSELQPPGRAPPTDQ